LLTTKERTEQEIKIKKQGNKRTMKRKRKGGAKEINIKQK